MGMAASQARYLALTARKTNTEWEGQQINQARTALANQSANLFNRLLAMEVPNAPKTTDYTELQYSYSDGDNESVIEEWHQLSNKNPDYNYVVKHYYMAEIFTGAKKMLQDPQVQIGNVLKQLEYDRQNSTVTWDEDGNIVIKYKLNNVEQEQKYEKITQDMVDSDSELKKALSNFETAKNLAKEDGTLTTDAVFGYKSGDTWHFFLANNYQKINESQVDADEALKEALTEFEKQNNLIKSDGSLTLDKIFGYQDSDGKWHFTYENTFSQITEEKTESNLTLKEALQKYEEENGLLNEDGTLNFDNIYGYRNGNEWTFYVGEEDSQIIKPVDNVDYSTQYGPSYVGNSKLTELNKLIVNDKIDQVADLAQILRDCPNSNIRKYVSFDDMGNLQYNGSGIYTFELYGNTYYTTEEDLATSAGRPYDPKKPIDAQAKLAYYNASYVSKKIEETNKALLETDGKGRFKTVKFDDDSIVYDLNVETVTDEAAYQDAMNQYLYKKEQYEKTIADINAKTSIIQQEDRTLELRLKQLDTEQNALSVEMDAVKKVIKDNVDKTFKTFSD